MLKAGQANRSRESRMPIYVFVALATSLVSNTKHLLLQERGGSNQRPI